MTADEVAQDRVDAALKVHPLFFAYLALLAFRSSGGRRGKPYKVSAHGMFAPAVPGRASTNKGSCNLLQA